MATERWPFCTDLEAVCAAALMWCEENGGREPKAATALRAAVKRLDPGIAVVHIAAGIYPETSDGD